MGDQLKYVFKKMCEYVDADFDQIDFTKEGWYTEYTWSPEQENDFKKWLVEQFLTNNELSQAALSISEPSLEFAEMQANMFLLAWGWKTNYKDTTSRKI